MGNGRRLAAMVVCLAMASTAQAKKPLNVLFIAVDDMRVELGCYGDTQAKTPNLDRLASRGTVFQRAYCQQALCNPSRASLLTGRRPDHLGVWDLVVHFRDGDPDIVTLPQHFKNQGYFTQDIGKIFHNWRTEIHGDPASWSVPAVMHYDTHGNDTPRVEAPLPPELINLPRTECRDVPDEAYFDGRIANLAVTALGEMKQRNEPFFLAVGFWKPHLPFNAPKKYWDMYERDEILLPSNPEPPTGVPAIALHDARELKRGLNGKDPSDEQTRTYRHGYYAAISYLDAQVGKVLGELERLGLADSTVVVFWSDHGFHLGEHHLWAKTSNFELDARVPLIVARPGDQGAQTEALVELLDLYPTLVEVCGLPTVDKLDGASLVPLLNDADTQVKDATLTQHPRPAYYQGQPQAMGYSIRTDRYRYTQWRDFKTHKIVAEELYDHVEDPRETVNLAAESSSERSELKEALAEKIEATGPRFVKGR